MQLKPGVILAGLDPRMRPVLKRADRLWREYGQELVVTSGLDGTHSAGSLHYYGLALDFRTRYFDKDRHPEIAEQLSQRLPSDRPGEYTVVLHETHIHVQFKPHDFP